MCIFTVAPMTWFEFELTDPDHEQIVLHHIKILDLHCHSF